MTEQDVFDMAREVCGKWPRFMSNPNLQAFAKLVAAKEREAWKEIVEDQRLRLQALNEIIGGEDSTTTGNILSYSRWEMRLEDAVKEEREACAKLVEDSWMAFSRASNVRLEITPFPELSYVAKVIRARGEA